MSFRSEIKFRLTKSELFRVKSHLKNEGMASLFPSRIIHSVYFDNAEWTMFHESNEGVMPRKKFRIRSYSGQIEKQFFEMKASSVEGRYKESKVIDQISTNEFLNKGRYFAGYGWCAPRIKISYQREYFRFDNLRITFDSNLTYSRYGQMRSYADEESVMEVKFGHNESCDVLYSSVNLIPSRFSKYERAVKAAAKQG
jgi:SPX domain protein involved in polyphosphate accumulation